MEHRSGCVRHPRADGSDEPLPPAPELDQPSQTATGRRTRARSRSMSRASGDPSPPVATPPSPETTSRRLQSTGVGALCPSAQDGQQADHGQDDDDDHDNGPEQVHSLGSSDLTLGGRLSSRPDAHRIPTKLGECSGRPSLGAGGSSDGPGGDDRPAGAQPWPHGSGRSSGSRRPPGGAPRPPGVGPAPAPVSGCTRPRAPSTRGRNEPWWGAEVEGTGLDGSAAG